MATYDPATFADRESDLNAKADQALLDGDHVAYAAIVDQMIDLQDTHTPELRAVIDRHFWKRDPRGHSWTV